MLLFEHNQVAYENALKLLSSAGKAAVIHPTGTGKSFIALKLCADYPQSRVCWLSPSEYIFKTQLENWQKAGGGDLQNIQFFTYAKLMSLNMDEIAEIQPDFIVLDEFHRCGARMWGQGLERLKARYPKAKILGLSATNIRYLDSQRDMAEELFDDNIASAMTLGEAIVRGILNPPKYVLSVLSYQKELHRLEKKIRSAKNKAVRDEAEKYLQALRRALEMADGLDTVFDKHMIDRNGKYILFCANVEHLHEMSANVTEWFYKVDTAPHCYVVYSDDPENNTEFEKFKEDESEHLKLLFCVDMLNEGIHVENISGVILLRPTVSPIIYKQQIGRALSANKKKSAVIFDIVLNIENLYSIGEVEEEMEAAIAYYKSHGDTAVLVNEHFKVVDEVQDCIALFDKLNDCLTASWDVMYEQAKKYYEANGNLEITKRYLTEEGYALGSWLNTQRRVYSGKIQGILTDTQIEKLLRIGMRFENTADFQWKKGYEAAKSYYEEFGHLRVPVNEEQYHGIKLGKWIEQMRVLRKNHSQSLTSEKIAMLDGIEMVWNVLDYQWEQNFQAVRRYYEKNGNLNVPFYYVDDDGIRLGAWISNMRMAKENPDSKRREITPEQTERLNAIGMEWENRVDQKWNHAYQAACEYKKEHGNLNIPVAYISQDGCRLGRWIRHQRNSYKSGMKAERVAKLEEIGMSWG